MDKLRNYNRKTAYPGLIAFILLSAIFLNPKQAFDAALTGLNIFLQSVFPALLPFFITSEILIGLGMVDFFSVLLTPVMRPLFRCSGSSSFVWVMSITSGYPTGARLTAQLCKQKTITAYEGQRILSFSSTSGPLFMISAVGIGILGSALVGKVILISHYLAALLVGLIFRFYRIKDDLPSNKKYNQKKAPVQYSKAVKDESNLNNQRNYKTQQKKRKKKKSSFFQQTLEALNASRKKDGRPIGQLMSDAVRNSVNSLLVVGGFIIFFSVVITILLQWISSPLIKAMVGGLFEVSIGSKLISDLAVPMQIKIAVISFMIGWSGLSIHAQSAGLLSGTGINIRLFIFGKFLHGLLAAIISIPVLCILYPDAWEVSVMKPSIILPGWKEVSIEALQLLISAFLFLCFFSLLSHVILWIIKKLSY